MAIRLDTNLKAKLRKLANKTRRNRSLLAAKAEEP